MQESGGQDYSCILVEQGIDSISHNLPRLHFLFSLKQLCFLAVLRIRVFLGLLDPDPDPTIIKQKSKKNPDSYWFVTAFCSVADPGCLSRIPDPGS